MDREDHSNIFDEASKLAGKKKKKSKGTKKNVPPSSMTPIGDQDLEEMLKKLHNMDDDLQQRMDKVCILSGMSPKEVKRFIENPDNFSTDDWSQMQQKKEALEKKIYTGIGDQSKKHIMKKKKKKMQKGRRGKTLGSRKGWIQM